MNQIPTAIGPVLCELVIVDEKTRNLTPVNCFGARKLNKFPEKVDFHVVAWLADGFGKMSADLIVRRLDTLEEVYRRTFKLRFTDRLQDMRFIARVRDCLFPVAGYYEVSLSIDKELIAHRRIQLST